MRYQKNLLMILLRFGVELSQGLVSHFVLLENYTVSIKLYLFLCTIINDIAKYLS